jgi:hypothetical protein
MAVTPLVHITTHTADAQAQLPYQYQGLPKWASLVDIFGSRAQALEDVGWDVYSGGNILTDEGAQLDQTGDIVGLKRGGVSDAVYQVGLLAQIGVNTSEGTPENLISIFQKLMGAVQVLFNNVYPAKITMAAVGAAPIAALATIRTAVQTACTGGVGVDFLVSAPTDAWSFQDVTSGYSPTLYGLGDYNDPSIGGYFGSTF